jgi:hypothetical protein
MKKILSAITAAALTASMATTALPGLSALAAPNGKQIGVVIKAADQSIEDGANADLESSISADRSTVTLEEGKGGSIRSYVYLDGDMDYTFYNIHLVLEQSDEKIAFSDMTLSDAKGSYNFTYNGTTKKSTIFPTILGSVNTIKKTYTAPGYQTAGNMYVTAKYANGAYLTYKGLDANGNATADISYKAIVNAGDSSTTDCSQTLTIDKDGNFSYYYYDSYVKKEMTEQIPNFSMDKLPAVGGYFPSFCDDMVVNNSSPMGFNTFCEKSTDLPFFAVTVDVPADMPAGTYTVGIDLDNSKGHSKIAFDDGQSVPQQYEPVNYPMTIVVGDGGPVSKDTTTTTTTTVDKPVTTTTTTSNASSASSSNDLGSVCCGVLIILFVIILIMSIG